MKMKKFFALLLCLLCLMSIAAPVYATDAKALACADGYTVCEENTDTLSRVGVSAASAQENAWAALRMNTNRTDGTLLLRYGNFTYNISLSGYVEGAADGYVGHYQGWFSPNSQDNTFYPMLYKKETALLASVNAVFYQNDVFFTLVIGYIGDGCTPVTMAFGERSNGINAATASYIAAAKSDQLFVEVQEAIETNAESRTSIDAEVRYQKHQAVTATGGTSGLELGQVSIFHANELRNQSSTPVYVKANCRATNACTYAIDYFDIDTNSVTAAARTASFTIGLFSDESWLTIEGNDYGPVSTTNSISLRVPWFRPSLAGSAIKWAADVADVDITISSVTATTSGGGYAGNPLKVEWYFWNRLGFSNTGGDYKSQKCVCGWAYFRSDATFSSDSVTGHLNATAKISYDIFTEDNTFLTQNTYTFTTAPNICSNTIKVLQ